MSMARRKHLLHGSGKMKRREDTLFSAAAAIAIAVAIAVAAASARPIAVSAAAVVSGPVSARFVAARLVIFAASALGPRTVDGFDVENRNADEFASNDQQDEIVVRIGQKAFQLLRPAPVDLHELLPHIGQYGVETAGRNKRRVNAASSGSVAGPSASAAAFASASTSACAFGRSFRYAFHVPSVDVNDHTHRLHDEHFAVNGEQHSFHAVRSAAIDFNLPADQLLGVNQIAER